MPYGRTPRYRKSKKSSLRTRRNLRVQRSLMYNPRPIFTESFLVKTTDSTPQPLTIGPNSGIILGCAMSQLPQRNNYVNLYQKYRILKAKWILIPTFNTQAADPNSAGYNASISLGIEGMSRFVFAVDDSPNLAAPLSEDAILQHNGCKIVQGKTKLTIVNRPVPDTNDALGNKFTMKRKFINFSTGAVDTPHYGVSLWHSQPVVAPAGNAGTSYFIYCKLTFQLSDPR